MDNKIKTFKMIMKKSNSDRVILLTNHYQIIGTVHECEECNKDNYINLTDVYMCDLTDVYDRNCEYETRYDWLHINLEKIIGFSFI